MEEKNETINVNNIYEKKRSFSNDFAYPSLQRKDLMYLNSINSRDFPIRKINQINTKRDWSLNLYNLDIEKSTPKKSSNYINKIDFINKTDDIEKAQPEKVKILNYPNFILNTRDIEKAYPAKDAYLSEIKVNNNNISHLSDFLSHKNDGDYPIRKFIRNQIDISDIEGAKPKKLLPFLFLNKVKNNENNKNNNNINNDNINEMNKSSVLINNIERKRDYDSFNYNDITENKKKYRNTNPLDPDYGVYGGNIEKNHPYISSYHFRSRGNTYMSNDDIKGTLPGSKNKYNLLNIDRSYLFNTSDIDGAVADSKKYGMITNRNTNPLNPKYQYLGRKENLDYSENKKNNNNSFEISKEKEEVLFGKKINKFNHYNNNNSFNKSANYRYGFDNDKMVSQSCNNIFYRGEKKYNNNLNNYLNSNHEDKKPIFNPEYYNKPNPNYERIHHDIRFSRKNPEHRLDNIMKRNLEVLSSIKSNDKNNIENIRKKFEESKKIFRLKSSNSFSDIHLKKENKDTIYSKLNQKPCYEEQFSYFLKDNSYKP